MDRRVLCSPAWRRRGEREIRAVARRPVLARPSEEEAGEVETPGESARASQAATLAVAAATRRESSAIALAAFWRLGLPRPSEEVAGEAEKSGESVWVGHAFTWALAAAIWWESSAIAFASFPVGEIVRAGSSTWRRTVTNCSSVWELGFRWGNGGETIPMRRGKGVS